VGVDFFGGHLKLSFVVVEMDVNSFKILLKVLSIDVS
jgi:hypothetical protein